MSSIGEEIVTIDFWGILADAMSFVEKPLV